MEELGYDYRSNRLYDPDQDRWEREVHASNMQHVAALKTVAEAINI